MHANALTKVENLYAFDFYPMPGFPDGFPVVLSTDLDEAEVQEMVQYMVDGSFLDSRTESLLVHLVFYNANAGQFANLKLDFVKKDGSGIVFKYKVQPMDVQVRAPFRPHPCVLTRRCEGLCFREEWEGLCRKETRLWRGCTIGKENSQHAQLDAGMPFLIRFWKHRPNRLGDPPFNEHFLLC